MAQASYLSRREGRYYLQVRFSPAIARLMGRQLYRASLRTADYRRARIRVSECIGWLHRMNDTPDFTRLIELNVRELRTYLADRWPVAEDRLQARRNYEELLKNLNRRAKAAGCDPDMIEPGYIQLLNRFVQQNVDAENHLRHMERVREYERGRADMQAALQSGAMPSSFGAAGGAWDGHDSRPEGFHAPHAFETHALPKQDLHSAGEPTALTKGVPAVAEPNPTTVDSRARVSLRFSDALEQYVREDIEKKRSADLRDDVVLIINFLIDQMGDPLLHDFNQEAASRLDGMIPEIPNRENIPRMDAATLSLRYEYAKAHGWSALRRLTESRIRNGFHTALGKFFDWAIMKGHYPHERPVFSEISEENLVALPRDSFEDGEIELIFTQALFTGCKSVARCWQPGPYFLQSHIYWAYLLSLLTGMRAGEIGRIKLDDIKEKDGIFYLYLRGFDPTKGRVARKEVERFKTEASWRVIPLHPLLLDLGLLERIDELRELSCPYLFPEWQPYQKPNGDWRWGQPVTKSWQYLKELIKIERKDVALYSTRHWFADLVDNTDIKDATRRRLMGHKGKSDVPSGYGAKNRLTTRDLGELTKQSAPAIEKIMPALLEAKQKADRGDLVTLKPWLQRANWSAFYRAELGLSKRG